MENSAAEEANATKAYCLRRWHYPTLVVKVPSYRHTRHLPMALLWIFGPLVTGLVPRLAKPGRGSEGLELGQTS